MFTDLRRRVACASLPTLAVWGLMLAYLIFFSAYTMARHDTLNSFAADLSFIDQPMWNTLHGHFLERTMDARQVSRVGEHLEPIILPVALAYLVWDDVRASLIIQTLVLALGALPVYWIARHTFADLRSRWRRWLPVVFAFVYLMYPALQAANVADFHADPFIVAPLLFAFWYGLNRRFFWMWLWALVAMLTKENLPAVTFMLGLWWVLFPAEGRRPLPPSPSPNNNLGEGGWMTRPRLTFSLSQRHGLALMSLSLIWFLVATFVIVAPLARDVYGTDTTVYFANRYGLQGGLAAWLTSLFSDPQRWLYLVDLLAPVSWLALLAPEVLLLGLPVLAANFLSNFAGQYSGQQHYSAPLAPVFVLAAIYGSRRLAGWLAGWKRVDTALLRRWGWTALAAWLLVWSLGYHHLRGWTPLARDYTWFQATDHTRLAERFFDQIPPEAAVSTTPPLHPHLAHRRQVYLYPTVADAGYILLDVSGATDAHPNDVYATYASLVETGEFGILDAADGYLLLKRDCLAGECSSSLPLAFYDFARAGDIAPEYPLDLSFALAPDEPPVLRCLGYDLVDDPVWRQTRVRLYWRALAPLPEDVQLWPFAYAADGVVVDDPAVHPLVAPIWYPPHEWELWETVMVETLPADLGSTFFLGTAAVRGDRFRAAESFTDPAQRLPLYAAPPVTAWQGNTWAQVGAFARQGRRLIAVEPGPAMTVTDQRFGDQVQLLGYRVEAAEDALSVVLGWRVEDSLANDYTVFVHLLTADGSLVAQSDAAPHWVAQWPTSRWAQGEVVLDGHRLPLPSDLPAGEYRLRVGLYDWQTLERLPLVDLSGQPVGDAADLGVWTP